jgi:hypothetical protein
MGAKSPQPCPEHLRANKPKPSPPPPPPRHLIEIRRVDGRDAVFIDGLEFVDPPFSRVRAIIIGGLRAERE